MKKKIMQAFGTRPEAIKMCPLVKQLKQHPGDFETQVCVTSQHREMLDQVLQRFGISHHLLTDMRDVFDRIVEQASQLPTDANVYRRMVQTATPYVNGQTAPRIAEILKQP